jgi:MoaA/NifB/PqqE/SkfB family radical SAM enzyme
MKIYQFELTNKCNMRCRYCPTGLGDLNRPKGFSSPQIEDAIRQNITNNKDEILWLNGWGEPLLHPFFHTIVKRFSESGIDVGMNTNGALLRPFILENLIKFGIKKVILSVHSKESIQHLPELEKQYKDFKDILSLVKLKQDIKIDTKFVVEKKKLRNTFYCGGNSDLREGVNELIWDKCSFLHNREYVVLYNGNIIRCCDSWNGPVLGNILNTSDIINLKKEEYYLTKCFDCKGYGNWEKETERKKVK